jgi:hypothetical protein
VATHASVPGWFAMAEASAGALSRIYPAADEQPVSHHARQTPAVSSLGVSSSIES